MKIAIIAITTNGVETGIKVNQTLIQAGHQVDLYSNSRGQHRAEYQVWDGGLGELFADLFPRYDAVCCVMALGIVLRLVGPLAVHKSQDPAVLVLDEAGQFVISALSGHLGGANALAREIANAIHAIPVITTASDVQGKLAVDELARQLGWALEPLSNLVAVNSVIVNGQTLPVVILDKSVQRPKFGPGYSLQDTDQWRVEDFPKGAVVITSQELTMPLGPYIVLHPRNILVGIGCRKGTSAVAITEALTTVLQEHNLSIASLKAIATIEAKRDEPGLQEVVRGLGLPLYIFTSDEINRFTQDYQKINPEVALTRSEFVYQKMGVGGVCEPVALMSGKHTKLLQTKVGKQGVTIALAVENL